MKIVFKNKSKAAVKPKLRNPVSESMGGSVPSWLMTDPRKKHEASDEAKMQRNRSFIPELWLKPGEDRVVRFRHVRDVGTIWAYSLKLKNGRFTRVTAPANDEVDLFRDELGLKPSFKAIYEVIDIEGFVDKKTGKRKRNLPRFFVASHKIYEALEKLANKKGGLNLMDIEISRVGEGNQTTYLFQPEDKSPMTAEMKAAEKLHLKVPQLFAPPSEAEQRSLLNQVVPNDYK